MQNEKPANAVAATRQVKRVTTRRATANAAAAAAAATARTIIQKLCAVVRGVRTLELKRHFIGFLIVVLPPGWSYRQTCVCVYARLCSSVEYVPARVSCRPSDALIISHSRSSTSIVVVVVVIIIIYLIAVVVFIVIVLFKSQI